MARDEPDPITYPDKAEDFIYVERTGQSESGKTQIWKVRSKSRHGLVLGEIKWKSSWRKYAFYPESETLYDPGCLRYIAQALADRTHEHYTA